MSWLASFAAELLKLILPWLFKKVQDEVVDQLTETDREKRIVAAKKKYAEVMANPASTEEEKGAAYAELINSAHA